MNRMLLWIYFWGMVQKWIFALLLLFALITSCEKDNEVDGSSAADITFRNDSGYTFTNDTVGLSDTLRIWMIAAQGTDPLELFVLNVSYDEAPATGTDTADINMNPYMFDKQVITRSVAGTEKWTFGVIEGDGDRTQRSITLVTQ